MREQYISIKNSRHESLKLGNVEYYSLYDQFDRNLMGRDYLRGPTDIAHNCGNTRVATASLSTFIPIRS
jgi:hypothetical protein